MTDHLLQFKQQGKERKDALGECFTPLTLVDEILNKFPKEVWIPSKTFMDPSSGSGNFLVRVIAYKIFNGSTAEEALKSTYGVELMSDNHTHSQLRVLTNAFYADIKGRDKLLTHLDHEDELDIQELPEFKIFFEKYKHIVEQNIVCHDALTYDYSFDIQIPNPNLVLKEPSIVLDIIKEKIDEAVVEPIIEPIKKQPNAVATKPVVSTKEKKQQELEKAEQDMKTGYTQKLYDKITKLRKELNNF